MLQEGNGGMIAIDSILPCSYFASKQADYQSTGLEFIALLKGWEGFSYCQVIVFEYVFPFLLSIFPKNVGIYSYTYSVPSPHSTQRYDKFFFQHVLPIGRENFSLDSSFFSLPHPSQYQYPSQQTSTDLEQARVLMLQRCPGVTSPYRGCLPPIHIYSIQPWLGVSTSRFMVIDITLQVYYNLPFRTPLLQQNTIQSSRTPISLCKPFDFMPWSNTSACFASLSMWIMVYANFEVKALRSMEISVERGRQNAYLRLPERMAGWK